MAQTAKQSAAEISDDDGLDWVRRVRPVTELQAANLKAYVTLLRKWQPIKNLVAPSTLPDVWRRHVADGAQTITVCPDARRWLDIGSGAGFPGLVSAIFLKGEAGASVTLVESNGRKAAFLTAVVRELGLPAKVLSERIESLPERNLPALNGIEAVSARALASLDKLLEYTSPWLTRGARGVFHKGQDFVSETAIATQSWDFDLVKFKSPIEDDSLIAVISNLCQKPVAGTNQP